MRDLLKRLSRMIVGYGAIQWAGPFLSLIFTPIITRALTPGDYGVADYLLTVVSALSTFALLGLPSALTTHFNDQPENLGWQRTVTGSAFAMVGVSGILFGTTLFVLAPTLTTFVPILGPYTALLRLMAVVLMIGLTGSVLTTASQAALRVRWGMVFSLISIIGTVMGNILFIVVLRLGTTGMILTSIATGLSTWVAAMILMRRMIGRPTPLVMRTLLRSGSILLPTVMAFWALQVSDRLILGQLVTGTELGYYAIANRMAGLVGVAMGPIYASWTPLALAVQHTSGSVARYVSMSRYLIVTVLAMGLGIGLFSTEILIVLTRPAYLPAAPYVGFLAYMYVFSGFGAVLTTGALMGKQLASVTGAIVTGAIINVVLNFLLIPQYGLWGATLATVIGYGVPQVILYISLRIRYPIPYPVGRFTAALGVQLVLMLLGLVVSSGSFQLRIALKLAIFAVFPLMMLLLRMITPFEVKQAQLFLRNRLRLAMQ
jgi:O-antigen/teichoic acid export membrane protein